MDSDSPETHSEGANDEDVLTTSADRAASGMSDSMDTHDQQQSGISLDNRSLGLRRHATKYPHGLAVCVQTIDDGGLRQPANNYSRASTLRSSRCDDRRDAKSRLDEDTLQQRKYQVGGLFSSPENLAELHVRRYKYPLTGNYYLDPQEAAAKSPMLTLDYAKRLCNWKYLRWPLIFAASVLVFFGLITYSIWLHDINVARERYLQQRKHHHDEEAKYENIVGSNGPMELSTAAPTTATGSYIPQESTMLRALSSRYRYRSKEQKLTTIEYALSKGVEGWDKHRKDDITGPHTQVEETTTMASDAAALVPVNAVDFQSEHQRNLGIAVEDDERVLRLINGLYPSSEPSTTTSYVDTFVKVSPTIPPVTPNKPTVPMTTLNAKSSALDSRCYSTTLPMCQGVLDYDLTYNVSAPFAQNDFHDYQALINSNCSLRSVEFVCAVLEPECRPSHIGILPPCRRICKAILEACSEIIANSDTLTATFDCNAYPDTNDPHRCEDPTRRKGYCYDNEFECYDRSCIPQQWQCDNIKDCSAGEDEDNCLICDQADEFRCRSNEKCVPETSRCDMKYDCFDGSDEESCSDYDGDLINEGGLRFNEEDMNAFPRVFSYASILSPNQTNGSLYTYITAPTDDQNSRTAVAAVSRSGGVSKEEVTNTMPTDGLKGFVNFRDSKEIMLTSDSENNFKFSSAREIPSAASTTPLQPAASILVAVSTEPPKERAPPDACAAHQLRCVSGKCITVDQLCDKKMDCPDGFDELMCVYKDRTTTVRNRGTTILPNPFHTTSSNTTRSDKRTLRTTIKRKIKQ